MKFSTIQLLMEVKCSLHIPSDVPFIVHIGTKFNKNYNKVIRNTEVLNKLNSALKEVLYTGKCSINGTHYIEHERFRSEVTGQQEFKFVIVPISLKHDVRLCFKYHPQVNILELYGIGRASDIGYKHN